MAKSKKRNGFQLSVLAASLCLTATGAYGAGLGKITIFSPLGQPLRAEIDVSASREELVSMNARLAPPEAFRQVGIEYAPGIAGIRFAIDKRKDGQPYLRMTSDRPINEPFLDILVELTWSSGRMVREYTVLLDPPESLSPAPVAVAIAAPAVKAAPAPVPAPAVVPPAAAVEPVAVTAPAPAPAPEPEPAPAVSSVAEKPAAESAPEPVPQPTAAATDESDAAMDDSQDHLVRRGDTLTKIAVANKAEGISLDQMLVALFRGNQEAFVGGNMNRLRAGKILNIPSAEAAAAVTPAEARQVVVAQARDFNAYRSRLAASVAATVAREEAAMQQDAGKIAPKLADRPAAPEAVKDTLEVSRTEAARDTKELQGRITALEEDLVARERALKEANSRVADLERNLADLKRLAELKSEAGTQMQAEPAKPVVEATPAATEPIATKPEEATPAVAVEAPPVVETPVAPPAVEPAEPEAPKLPLEDTAAPPVPVEEPSFIDENPLLVYGGGGLLALLLGYLGFSASRRKSRDDETVQTASRLSEGDLMANSVFGTTGGQAVDTNASIQTDFSQASLSAIDTDEGVDPVAEADVYMAYGRDAQAEEILVEALKTDPTRVAIYLKLLEIYSGHKNAAKFEKAASDLHGQTGGAGPDWEKAAAMGRALDPANPLYAGGDLLVPPQIEPVMPEVEVPASEFVPVKPVAMENTVTLPGQLSQLAEAVKPEAPANLGFDLDLGATGRSAPSEPDVDFALPEIGRSSPSAGQASTDMEPVGGLDFEFDLDAPATTATAAKETPIDFSGINLDLVTATGTADELPELEGMEGDSSDVATKLELAQAYEEMGDREGARELLEEVVQEGNAQQQELARAKLSALDA